MRTSPRFDIEALRALAVAAVMLYHAGIGPSSGGFAGVDIFFVISGYLIVGLLHKEWLEHGKIQLLEFWGRRARRLLPAATVVLAFTAMASTLLAGRLTGHEIRLDLLAATLFAANLRFGTTGSDYWSLDYLSPALHFWSLGVEEQFYIFTPLAIALTALALKRRTPRWLPVTTLSLLFVASFGYCLWLSSADPVWSYYSPLARAWEFAAGGLMAVLPWPDSYKPSNRLRLLAWAALIWSVIFIDSSGWPNATTLIPVVATAVLLRVGFASPSVAEIAQSPQGKWLLPISRLGGISYSAYLWHWPLLWIAAAMQGLATPEQLSLTSSLPLLALTLVLAEITKRYIEDPWRFSPALTHSAKRSLGTGWATSGVAAVAISVSALLPAAALLPPPPQPVIVAPTPSPSGTTTPDLADDQEWVEQAIADLAPKADRKPKLAQAKPQLQALSADKPANSRKRCNLDKNATDFTQNCVFGDVASSETIALFGDSHADQFFAGLNVAAKESGKRLLLLAKPSCPAADVRIWLYNEQRSYPQCDKFRERAIERILQERPQLVVISNLVTYSLLDPKSGKLVQAKRGQKLWRTGLERTLKRLTSAGIKVLLIRDLPNWGRDIPDCLATYGAATCSPAPDLSPKADDLKIAKRIPGASALDLTTAVCEIQQCFPVRGGTFVVRDDTHLSMSYSKRLAPLWQAILSRFAPA